MASSHILQIFLRVTVQNQIRIAQRIVVDEVVQFRPLRHGHVQFILDPGAVNGNVKQKRQWTVCLPVDIPTGWEPRRNLAVMAGTSLLQPFMEIFPRSLYQSLVIFAIVCYNNCKKVATRTGRKAHDDL